MLAATGLCPAQGALVRAAQRALRTPCVTRPAASCSRLTRATPATQLAHSPRSRVQVAPRASGQPSTSTNTVESVKLELKVLEEERDQAIAVAEQASKTVVKLGEMLQLLENLAMEKLKAGDDEGARAVLKEKGNAKEAMDKTSHKAQVNFSLAAKLAVKIGEKQHELLDLLRASGRAGPDPAPQAPASSSAYEPPSSSFPSSSGNYIPGRVVPRWQQSLEEARERIRAAEARVEWTVQEARSSAEVDIAAARERLRSRERESILEAKARLQQRAEESITEAQARLRRQDAEVLSYVQRIMGRYRRGEYVSEEELEFAFRQLEKRSLL